jgi:hypothetical protein
MFRYFAAFIALVAVMNLMGFCWTKFRFLSTYGMGKDAVQVSIDFERKEKHLPSWVQTYSDLKEYYPNCCSHSRANGVFLFELLGSTRYNFDLSYPVIVNNQKKYVQLWYEMDCCGHVIESHRGPDSYK